MAPKFKQLTSIVLVWAFASFALADEVKTYSEQEQQRGWDEAKKGYEQLQAEKTQEMMRDKSHDGRVKIDTNTSVGAQTDPASVNIRTTTP